VTFTAPAACEGVVAVIVVLLLTTTLLAAVPPRLTLAPLTKFAPLIVTDVPPAGGPLFGAMLLTLGAGLPPAPPLLGKIVVSFLSAPGDEFK
jgi:hypothetical protein